MIKIAFPAYKEWADDKWEKMKRAMRRSFSHRNDEIGEFHVAIKSKR